MFQSCQFCVCLRRPGQSTTSRSIINLNTYDRQQKQHQQHQHTQRAQAAQSSFDKRSAGAYEEQQASQEYLINKHHNHNHQQDRHAREAIPTTESVQQRRSALNYSELAIANAHFDNTILATLQAQSNTFLSAIQKKKTFDEKVSAR